ncbi:MAG TPA: YggS family pyridoxal phosphate-dependent enzyme [Bacillales bacterium]|nr:YggS family pyridoxal phosphate-dependent enzyme [Bacillales bacterium]
MSVKENAACIRAQIEQACAKVDRDPDRVRVIAVTKYVSVETARAAVDAGVAHIGENRVEGFLRKWEALGNRPAWHFIGTLQSRKVKNIIDKVDYIHSLDRPSLAKEIEKRASRRVRCFVQVNVSGEDSKHGLPPEEVMPFIEKLADYPKIEVAGLMTMAPLTDDTSLIRSVFRRLRELSETVRSKRFGHAPCNELSMGMSNDFEIAVEEGATFVRIGTALVGKEF